MASHDLNDLPLTVGSVVWCQGHPWVLDGEPGADEPERRMWVGLNVNSAPWVRTRGNMAAPSGSWCCGAPTISANRNEPMPDPTFSTPHVHDLMSGFDPLDVYADMAYLARATHWQGGVPPRWCEHLAGELGTSPAAVIPLVHSWLLDQAVNGGHAERMAEIGRLRVTGADQ